MALYFYNSIEQPASANFPRSFSVAQTEIAHQQNHAGPQSKAVATSTTLTVSRGGYNPAASPYSSAYSNAYGGGASAGILIGKLLPAAEASVANQSQGAGTNYPQAVGGASTTAASVQNGVDSNQSAISNSTAGISYPTPYDLIFTVGSAAVCVLARGTARLIPLSAASMAAELGVKTAQAPVAGTSGAQVGVLFIGGYQVLTAMAEMASAVPHTLGKALLLVGGSIARSVLVQGRVEAAANTASIGLNLTHPARLFTTQAAVTAYLSIQMLLRSLSVPTASVLALARALAASHSATTTNHAAATRGVIWIIGTASAAAQRTALTTARLLGGASTSAVSRALQVGLPRQIVAGTVVLLQRTIGKFFSIRGGGDPWGSQFGPAYGGASQVLGFAWTTMRGYAQSLPTTTSQVVAESNTPQLTFQWPLAAVMVQAAGVARGIPWHLPATLSAAQALVRGIAQLLGSVLLAVTEPKVISLTSAHVVATVQALFAQASLSRRLLAANLQSPRLHSLFQRPIPTVVSQTAGHQITAAKILGTAITSAIARTAAVGTSLFIAVVNVADMSVGHFHVTQTLASSVSFMRVSRTLILPVGAAAALAFKRTVGKLISFAAAMGFAFGQFHSTVLSTVTANTAAIATPYGRICQAAQAQLISYVLWLFINPPPWATQQTVVLPRGGGRAEPPSFGPFDPDNQTTFGFDWSLRSQPGDPIIAASVVSDPDDINFAGPVGISGNIVQVIVLPFEPDTLPTIYNLRCTAVFNSGRISSFSVPLPVRNM